jgi:hypothetical protein
MTINDKHYTEKEPRTGRSGAAKALLKSCKGVTDKAEKTLGSPLDLSSGVGVGDYMGFKMSVRFDSFLQQFSVLKQLTVNGEASFKKAKVVHLTRK